MLFKQQLLCMPWLNNEHVALCQLICCLAESQVSLAAKPVHSNPVSMFTLFYVLRFYPHLNSSTSNTWFQMTILYVHGSWLGFISCNCHNRCCPMQGYQTNTCTKDSWWPLAHWYTVKMSGMVIYTTNKCLLFVLAMYIYFQNFHI